MNDLDRAEFAWQTQGANCSHSYLLPAVENELAALSGSRRLRIADLGCGNGFVTSRLAELGHEVIGVDSSSSGIALARASYPNLRFEEASLYDEQLPVGLRQPFDCIVCLEVIEHLSGPREALKLIFRSLKPGGHLILSTPYHGYLKNLAISIVNGWDRHFGVRDEVGHIKFFSKRTLSEMTEEAGFRITSMQGRGRLPWLWKSMLMVALRPV